MEIEIESKRNNPLLNRTEVYFIVKHPGEGTPNREIIRSELADKLNVKKENIIVNTIKSGFGIQEISGYAKVYSSVQKTKNLEQEYILARNKLIEADKKAKKEAAPAPTEGGAPEPPEEKKPEESTKPPEEPIKPPEEPKDEAPEPAAEQDQPLDEKPETQKEEAPDKEPIESKPPVEEPEKKEKSEEKDKPDETKEEKKEE
jgi:small subunit ribosomal protein S24e